MRAMSVRALLLIGALLGNTALAHAEVTRATPAENATVTAPKQVSLTFSEAVDLKFSTFKVYPLQAGGDPLSVNRAADRLVSSVMTLRGDGDRRADQGAPAGPRQTSVVNLRLKPGLKKGVYVVMWRALSADGHPVGGRYLFRVR